MIIYYYKDTGKIRGMVMGRFTTEDHLKIWVGDKDKNKIGRIIVNWKTTGTYDKNGKKVDPVKEKDKIFFTDIEPDHEQKEEMAEIDRHPIKVYNYDIDLKTKKLKKKDTL